MIELEKEPSTELCPRCGSILYTRGCYACSNNSCMFRWNTEDFNQVKVAMEFLQLINTVKELESLSDKVRQGIPIDFRDAIVVIEYQDRKAERRKTSPVTRFKLFFMKFLKR